jgi:hypothetical protein
MSSTVRSLMGGTSLSTKPSLRAKAGGLRTVVELEAEAEAEVAVMSGKHFLYPKQLCKRFLLQL